MPGDITSSRSPIGSQGDAGVDAPIGFICDPESADFAASAFPELKKNIGTNQLDFTLDYDKTTEQAAYWAFPIPAGAALSAAQISIFSRQATLTTGTVAWKVTTLTRGDDDAWDTAGNLDSVDAASVKAVAGKVLTQVKALTITGWAGARVLLVKIARDVASDNVDEDVKFMSAVIEFA